MSTATGCLKLTVFGLCATSITAEAQRTISGKVVDSIAAPVPYANVLHRGNQVIADDSGHFQVQAPSAKGVMHVRRIGYRSVDVEYHAGGDTTIVVVLDPLPAQLSRTVVLAQAAVRSLELHGFYRRLHDRQNGTNAGQFITAEEIEQRKPMRVTQLFDGRTGIKATRWKGLPGGFDSRCAGFASLDCWAPQGPGGCWMTVYYNGMRLPDVQNYATENSPTLVDDIALPGDIAGIEIYTTPGKTPPEYQSLSGRCGVVLLWSK